jgi:L-threonylcarbamoyladenylate synthase
VIFNVIAEILHHGGVIAYPTEAVYGLGCDPFNHDAVKKLLSLKQRGESKGLILVAANWEQAQPLIADLDENLINKALATWPGAVTWVFPAAEIVPEWIRGEHNSVAIRISAHPVVRRICEAFGAPIVSTSANVAGFAPARTEQDVLQQFPVGIDFIVPGEIGGLDKPTPIYDVRTGEVFRT